MRRCSPSVSVSTSTPQLQCIQSASIDRFDTTTISLTSSYSGSQSACHYASNLCIHLDLHMVPCRPQNEPVNALQASLRRPALKMGLRRWCDCCGMGCGLQFSLYFSLRPYTAAVDCRTRRPLHGSDLTLEVFDHDQLGDRSHHRGIANQIGLAIADEDDGEIGCYCLFWARRCLCIHLAVKIQ